MIKLKTEVNKSKLFRDFRKYADERYKGTYKEDFAKEQFMDGADRLFELLRLGDVGVSLLDENEVINFIGGLIDEFGMEGTISHDTFNKAVAIRSNYIADMD